MKQLSWESESVCGPLAKGGLELLVEHGLESPVGLMGGGVDSPGEVKTS